MDIKDFFVILCVLAILLIKLRKERVHLKKMVSSHKVFGYTMIYADQKGDSGKPDFGKLLYSSKYEFGKRIMPIELKSGSIGEKDFPHRGDYLQLCTYFLIIEDVYGRRPKYGRLVYRDHMFIIKNTRKVRKEVLKVAAEMHALLIHGVAQPNPSFVKCRPCICNGTVCQYSATKINKGDNSGNSRRKK